MLWLMTSTSYKTYGFIMKLEDTSKVFEPQPRLAFFLRLFRFLILQKKVTIGSFSSYIRVVNALSLC